MRGEFREAGVGPRLTEPGGSLLFLELAFRCVEMSPFSADKLSSFCLFSYTFRLPTSFINIFFSVFVPTPFFPLCPEDGTFPASGDLSAVFRVDLGIHPSLRATRRGGRVPPSSYANPSPGVLSTEFWAVFLPVGKNFTNSFHFFLPVGNPEWRVSGFQLFWRLLTPAGTAWAMQKL